MRPVDSLDYAGRCSSAARANERWLGGADVDGTDPFGAFRAAIRDAGVVGDEPFPDLRDAFAEAFLVDIAAFADETADLDVLGCWEEQYGRTLSGVVRLSV